MNRQEQILVWINNTYDSKNLPKSTGELYKDFKEQQNYNKTKASFSELLRKLTEKKLLTNPEYGKYSVSEEGTHKAQKLTSNKSENEKPPGYPILVKALTEYFMVEKRIPVKKTIEKDKIYKLKLSELQDYNEEIIDDFLNETSFFMDALQDATQNVSEKLNVNFECEIKPDIKEIKKSVFDIVYEYDPGIAVSFDAVLTQKSTGYSKTEGKGYTCKECGRKQETNEKCACGSKQFEVNSENIKSYKEYIFRSDYNQDTQLRGVKHVEKNEYWELGYRYNVIGVVRYSEEHSRKYLEILQINEHDSEPEEYRRKENNLLETYSNYVFEHTNENLSKELMLSTIISGSIYPQEKGLVLTLVSEKEELIYNLLKEKLVYSNFVDLSYEDKSDLTGKINEINDKKFVKIGSPFDQSFNTTIVRNPNELTSKEINNILKPKKTKIETGLFSEKVSVKSSIIFLTSNTEQKSLLKNSNLVYNFNQRNSIATKNPQKSGIRKKEFKKYLEQTNNTRVTVKNRTKSLVKEITNADIEKFSKDYQTVLKLSKAIAKSRLSDEADKEDVRRAQKMLNNSDHY